jgi:hypothetical protein
MKLHDPIKLTPAERADLGSISRHPGMIVLIEKILAGHTQQQLEMIHTVQPDDPQRVSKLDGISAVAFAMKLTLELVRREVDFNWRTLQGEEETRERAAKNEMEITQ